MKYRQLALSAVLLASLPIFGGCALFLVGAGVAVGVGSVAYLNGELRASEEVGVEVAWKASRAAMSELQFKVTKEEKDALAGKICSRRADGTAIEIYVKQKTEKVTEFRIRVGVFGDEALSKLIYEKIKKNF